MIDGADEITPLESIKRQWLSTRLAQVQNINTDGTGKPYISLECDLVVDLVCDALAEWEAAHKSKPVMR
jgi:hypothetical protein